ncbi:prefoldin subunit 3 [Atractiella rhizophila]|nr:prefoldin subunit 3 [Atractiella rhizophila]
MSSASSSEPPTKLTTNPRGIPQAPFIQDIPAFLGSKDASVEGPLRNLQEMLAKYRFMEGTTLNRLSGYEEKIPELERSIEVVQLLMERKEKEEDLETTFELADTLYSRARVEAKDLSEVYVWLGANTLLSYPLPQALELLTSKLSTVRKSLSDAKEDAQWLREQITVTEVNVARVFNWDVKRRRDQKKD